MENISFISYIKIDNILREKNIKAITSFYKKNFPTSEFIGIEEGNSIGPWVGEWDKYYIIPPEENYSRKTYCYNLGASKSTRDIFIFLDIDVIVNPTYIIDCFNFLLESEDNLQCMVGYNGTAIYLNQLGEKDFLKSNNIDDLYSKVGNLKSTGDHNEYGIVGNTHAVGGFLIMTRAAFNLIKGFNPLFKGWGYEDNEIVTRAHKLGVNVTKSNIPDNYLFHLPHHDINDNKSLHPHYRQNEAIAKFVDTADKQSLKKYIEQW